MANPKYHRWNPGGAENQTCDKCDLHRVATTDGWLYTWPDGTTEDRDTDDGVPPCVVKPAQAEQPKDWWAYR